LNRAADAHCRKQNAAHNQGKENGSKRALHLSDWLVEIGRKNMSRKKYIIVEIR
jgi:hypothetical protein